MSAIAVENVSKHWTTASGQVRAVDSISFALEPGTLNVLLGPSGCGKSTTLRLIAGLDHADTGRIWIDGRDVTDLPPARRRISMVFQSYALFPHLSVLENIVFGLRVRKTGHADRDRRLKRVSELLGLSALLDRKPGQLSGGQQQRVALGRALIAEAPVCLMDEPLSNLDAQLRQEMRLEIRNLQRQLGITMVYVTHDQVEAMSMADRVILLSGGRIEQNGAPVDLYETPANTFVARFIGTPPMNLLRLDKAGGEGGHRRYRGSRRCSDRMGRRNARRSSRACDVGARRRVYRASRERRIPGRRLDFALPHRRTAPDGARCGPRRRVQRRFRALRLGTRGEPFLRRHNRDTARDRTDSSRRNHVCLVLNVCFYEEEAS